MDVVLSQNFLAAAASDVCMTCGIAATLTVETILVSGATWRFSVCDEHWRRPTFARVSSS